MNCPKCGAAIAPGSKFCVTCGTPCNTQNAMDPQYQAPQQQYAQQPQQYAQQPQQQYAQQPAPQKAATKFDFKQILAQLGLIFNPLWAKVKPIVADKKKMSIIAGGFALLVIVAILCSVLTSGNGYIQTKQSIDYFRTDDGEYTIVVNNKPLKKTISSEEGIDDFDYSLDGKSGAILTKDGDLYGISGKKVVKLDSDVSSFVLSDSGKSIAYVVTEDDESTLFVTKINKAKPTEISDSVGGSYAISPKGDAVAYFEINSEGEEYTRELMLFRGKKSIELTDDSGASIHGLSNGGKQVYVSISSEGETTLYSYNQKGDRNKLSKFGGSVRFNADHTQIMFSNDEGKVYISNKGKEAKKAASDTLYLMIPFGSESHGSTYPVKNLYNHLYRTSASESYTYNVILLKKNSDKNVKLLSNVSNPSLDASAEYVYYIKNKELRVSEVSAGERASDKYKMLVDDSIAGFVVTPNRKVVYYADTNGTLYSANAKKKSIPREICDDIEGLDISANNTCYYITDGDLYATKNGKRGKRVLSDCTDVYAASNGCIYAETEDTLYCSTGSKKPKKVLSFED